jgi:ATP-binding cassette subfamily A (ABC1) protein 3
MMPYSRVQLKTLQKLIQFLELTGEETLYLIARVRGVKEKSIPKMVEAIVNAIDIGPHASKQIKSYSGGNKRRLSLGISLVGLPSILFLDEPTTGVDPKARRVIWGILSELRSLGTAIVLTSHSMEECEALCTNLSIMVLGQFKCLGSSQHIKSKFGSGYTLLVRVESEQYVEQTKRAIMDRFPHSILKEEHVLQLNFELKRTNNITWSQLFTGMEEICKDNHIEHYTLSQTSLEQVNTLLTLHSTILCLGVP